MDFYQWAEAPEVTKKPKIVRIFITPFQTSASKGYYGLRYEEERGYYVSHGLYHPDRVEEFFTPIAPPDDVDPRAERELISIIFKNARYKA
jgi:hypothetical protein